MKRRHRNWIIRLFLTAALTSSIPAAAGALSPALAGPQEEKPASLERGNPVERPLSAGELHAYTVVLSSGQYLEVVVEQKGINVVVVVVGPGGEKLVELDSDKGVQGKETISLIARKDETYRLEVRPAAARPAPGRYRVRISEMRAAGSKDVSRVMAQGASMEADRLHQEGTGESLRRSLSAYGEALQLYRDLNDQEKEAAVLIAIGELHFSLGEMQEALARYERSLSLRRALKDRRGEAEALNDIGVVLSDMGENRRALHYFQQALPLYRPIGERMFEADTLHGIGNALRSLGEYRKALDSFDQALELERVTGYRAAEIDTLLASALVHGYLGDHRRALESLGHALSMSKEMGNLRGESDVLQNIGGEFLALGDYQKAVSYFRQALAKSRTAGYRRAEAAALGNIGRASMLLGEYEQAIQSNAESLQLRQGMGDKLGEAYNHGSIGNAFHKLGKNQEALEHLREAARLVHEAGDRRLEARTFMYLADVHVSLADDDKALGYLKQALALNLALAEREREAETRYQIARLERDRGNVAEARRQTEAALALMEVARTKLESPELRASYLGSVEDVYELHCDLLMRLHRQSPAERFDVRALEASERARARSLLDLLAQARTSVREGVEPDLAERERSLRELLNGKLETEMRFRSDKHAEETDVLADEITRLTGEYEQVNAQIQAKSPRYAGLTQPKPSTLAEIQRELDSETLLLEYGLGADRSFLWAVTPETMSAYELPGRSRIETAAREMYRVLTERGRQVRFETAEERRARVARADEESAGAASALSRMLLAPVAAQLGRKRLVIVSDGSLQYVPFAALPDPGAEGLPLVAHHELVSLPSASVLSELRRQRTGREPPSKALVVLADPVFEKDDERLQRSVRTRNKGVRSRPAPAPGDTLSGEDLIRSAVESGVTQGGSLRIARLPFTRREAEAILALAPREGRMAALDFDASRATATGAELGRYRFVHFATHGFLNSLHPELSGLVLSLVGRDGGDRSGFLPATEVFNLKLSADLVVLSGCQTALGKEIKGEGLVGLTRGFMYAGAPRVLASLWNVHDAATAELMKRFYGAMLGPDRLRPAAALQSAQESMRKESRWTAPYFWSGFLLQGEWN